MTHNDPTDTLIILTGLAGAGKSEAINALEDLGYYCIDNLPVGLLNNFCDRILNGHLSLPCAVVIDNRDPNFLAEFPTGLLALRARDRLKTSLIFLEATDETLVRRFSETRRPHPLSREQSVLEGVLEERRGLEPIKQSADHILDTSGLTAHELRHAFLELSQGKDRIGLIVTLMSFGFKHGIPLEADLIFDVRFVTNPHFVPELSALTGLDDAVGTYLKNNYQTSEFLEKTSNYLHYLLPQYVEEGKSYLTIGIGCTGGRHRSVFLAEELHKRIKSITSATFRIKHRNILNT